MSSLIHIPAKQQPVINRLHDTMTQAVAYAAAIADNAIDDGVPLPMDLVDSFKADYDASSPASPVLPDNETHNLSI
jgi:hypothetical protein